MNQTTKEIQKRINLRIGINHDYLLLPRVVLVAGTSNDLFSKTYNAQRKSLSYASMTSKQH